MQTIRVTGMGKLSIQPDVVKLSFTASEMEDTYDEAVATAAKWIKDLSKLFEGIGFESDSIKSTGITVDSEYEWRGFRKKERRLLGYEYNAKAMIQFPLDVDILSEVIHVLSHSKMNQTFQIQYLVGDQKAAQSRLLRLAVQDAAEKARVLAGAAGQRLGRVLTIDYANKDYFPVSKPFTHVMKMVDDDYSYDDEDIYEDADEDSYPVSRYELNITPDDISISANVTVVWQIAEVLG